MPATVHVLCGPDATADLLVRYRAAAAEPGQALWLGPTHRAIEAVRETLLEGRCLVASQLFTFQDFADAVIRAQDPAARPLSAVQRRLLVEDIITDLQRRKRLSHFAGVADTRGFSEGVLALLTELRQAGAQPAQLVDLERPGTQQCAHFFDEYVQRLRRDNLFDLEGRLWHARDLLARARGRPFEDVRAVFVGGFTHFARVEMEILTALCHWVEALWLALPDEDGDERPELFARPRAVIERLASGGLSPPEYSAPNSGGFRPPFAGLDHVRRQLFRPLQSVERSNDADALLIIEGPGMLGEVRLVARQVKALLLAGTPAEDILLTVREVLPYADVVREVFSDYGIPLDVEGAEPLARQPIAAVLLRALRIPDDRWPFAAVTALLRSGHFRPEWPEVQQTPDVAQRAEALLRLLGQSRYREAYLRAVDKWADNPEPAPPDEQAEASRRPRISPLAVQCRPFLHRFFAAWDGAPGRVPLARHIDWLRRFADNLGITGRCDEDTAALGQFWEELSAWERLERRLNKKPRPLDRARFLRLLTTLAAEAGTPRTPRGPGRVRFLSAEIACGLSVDHVFIMGLGEGSFPSLKGDNPFFNEEERQNLRSAGLHLRGIGDRMPEEMLLFHGLVCGARQRLVLSYPAVDEKGQALLSSSFLAALMDCFEPKAIPVLARRMLTDGLGRDEPLSLAEYRVQVASRGEFPDDLPTDLAGNLRAAALVAERRFGDRQHNCYDGLLRHPILLAELRERFSGDRIISPTALETYIACPFRFLLEHVLHLEPLEEPDEDIEASDRGLVFHRALAGLHRTLKERGIDTPTADVDRLIREHLDKEVKQHAGHAGRAAEALWQIEGRRLQRRAARYRGHWEKFLATWAELELVPRPEHLEKAFGMADRKGQPPAVPLVIQGDGIEVRLGGRIDRVDVAETAAGRFFWIVDYKTGRSGYYTADSLKKFERLQLTLYALAVERLFFADPGARPLGLAYWLVTDTGPKVVLPGDRKRHGWFRSPEEWARLRGALEAWVIELVRHIRAGDFPLAPRSETCTETCPYAHACRITQARRAGKTWELALPTC